MELNKNKKVNPHFFPKWKRRTVDTHKRHLKLHGNRTYEFAFLGDSMMERWLTTMPDLWDEYFKDRCCNLGVGGDGVENLLFRLKGGYFDKDTKKEWLEGIFKKVTITKTVFLMIGTNNTGTKNIPFLGEGIMLIIKTIREFLPNVQIVVFGLSFRKDTCQSVINELNTILKGSIEYTYKREQVAFVPTCHLFDVETDYADLVHLSKAGYRKWLPEILKFIT